MLSTIESGQNEINFIFKTNCTAFKEFCYMGGTMYSRLICLEIELNLYVGI